MVKGRRRITSQQVAVRAGVSRSTVSFVLNNVPNMSFTDETRRRVLEAADEPGYVPNAAAKMLVSGETHTIGLVLAHAEHLQVDSFIPQLLYGLSRSSSLKVSSCYQFVLIGAGALHMRAVTVLLVLVSV